MRRLSFLLLGICLALSFFPAQSVGQKKDGFPANAAAPSLKSLYPAGAKPGSVFDLKLKGGNLAAPIKLLTSFPCKATFPTENNNGKDPASLLVKLDVPANAPIGFHTVRVGTAKGISNPRILCVDELPEVAETETNRSKQTAQVIPVPCVVAGRADAEANDYFKFSAKAGQRISFEILGRRLGSGIDPQLTLFDAATQRELPGGHSNDSPGLQTDPRLTYTFKKDGDYLVEVRDVSYRGGEDYFYRLRVGDFPCATSPIPMAAERGSKTAVSFAGSQVEGVAPVEITVPSDSAADSLWVTPRGSNGLPGWPVCLKISNQKETLEKEPNDSLAQAQKLAIPSGVTGRFLQKGEADYYSFSAKKDQRFVIEAVTQDLYSPTEIYMEIKDSKGGKLAESNPANPPRFDFKAPADGEFFIAVEHLHLWGGPAEVYHLSISEFAPGFDLSLQGDRIDGPAGIPFNLPVIINRREFAETIEIAVEGSKGVSGKLSVVKGQPAKAGDPVSLQITILEDTPVGPEIIRVVGTAQINGKPFKAYASIRAPFSASLANLPIPPRTVWNDIGLGIQPRPPFTLSLKLDPTTIAPGKNSSATVTASRKKGFDGEIGLTLNGLPANVSAKVVPLAAGKTEVKFEITSTDKAAPATPGLTVTGKAKVDGKDETATSPAAVLTIKK